MRVDLESISLGLTGIEFERPSRISVERAQANNIYLINPANSYQKRLFATRKMFSIQMLLSILSRSDLIGASEVTNKVAHVSISYLHRNLLDTEYTGFQKYSATL